MTTLQEKIDVMMAFQVGKDIQRLSLFGGNTASWKACLNLQWDWSFYDYRIAPQKTRGYRRFLVNHFDNAYVFVSLLHEEHGHRAESIENGQYFIRWIDTTWQYEEV